MSDFFRYIWRNSRVEQIRILAIVLASFPFYFLSLDLPKYIISDAIQGAAFRDGRATVALLKLDATLPNWLGGFHLRFDGFDLGRIDYLFALSGMFLLLVVINGGFKYVINMRKGALGERLLQRLRFDLFASLLRLTPEAARRMKPAEAASVIKDEVEPIGGFVGDAFVQPVFLGGQALTALAFILIQNLSLGLIAAAIILAQAVIIPRLRREQLRLGKQRQIASRALAGKIGEVVESLGEVANHGTHGVESGQVASRLETLFGIRYRLYGRKFAVKLLNNLLSQAAPFLFYTVGGYYALTGRLDIGQLVAVIAAYRDLPPPIKELIDWDQRRLDAEAKFRQVGEQFAFVAGAGAVAPPAAPADDGAIDPAGRIVVTGVSVLGPAGDRLLDRVSVTLPLGRHVALADAGEGASALAQVLGGRITDYSGSVTLAGRPLAGLDPALRRRSLAYVAADTVILDGSLRDNILYGLRQGGPDEADPEAFDLSLAGCADAPELERRLIAVLETAGLDDLVFRYGLARRLSAAAAGEMARRIPDLRGRIRVRLEALGVADAIEPYDPARFIRNAAIGENLLFGWPTGGDLTGERLGRHGFARQALDDAGLTGPLTELGRRIAATMLDIFEGLPPDHILFEQFAFFPAADFPAYRDLLGRFATAEPAEPDRIRLLELSMLYIEPRHRLGLLSPALEEQIVAARATFRSKASGAPAPAVAFHDRDAFCEAAPLRDNLLFGAVAHGASSAQEPILRAIREALTEVDMAAHVYRLGLDQPAGYAGRLLFPSARTGLALARSLVRRPRILILNDALVALGQVEAAAVLARIRTDMAGRTLIVAGRHLAAAPGFDLTVAFEGPKIAAVTDVASGEEAAQARAPTPQPATGVESEEMLALRRIALFAGVDMPRLRLLAFTSERVRFAVGETLFRQGDASDSAYVILAGAAEVSIETADGSVAISRVGENAIVGEMGIVTGDPRSATIVARTELTALRLRKEVFLALLAEFPQMALSVTRLMVRRLQDNVTAIGKVRRSG